MTSGITSYTVTPILENFNLYKSYTFNEIVAFSARYQKKYGCNINYQCFKPGSHYGYSNTNYIIAAMIVQKGFDGHEFSHVMKEKILNPFHQKYSADIYYAMNYNNEMLTNMIHGYTSKLLADMYNPLQHQDSIFAHEDVTTMSLYYANAAGGMTGSTGALTTVIRAMFSDDFFNTSSLLRTTGLVRMDNANKVSSKNINTQCFQKNSDGCYGMGVTVYYLKNYGQVWTYGGSINGYQTTYYWFKNRNITLAISYNVPINAPSGSGIPKLISDASLQVYDAVSEYLNSK